nr:unnamed protein product [Callosobruchus chinensis]
MVWAEISLEARTELYIIPRGSLTAVRYVDEILQDFVVTYVDFICNNFIPMHHNARPPDRENYSTILKRCRLRFFVVASVKSRCESNPVTLNEFIAECYLGKWDLIPQEDIRHLILGMPKECKQSFGHAKVTLVNKNAPVQFLLATRFIFQ